MHALEQQRAVDAFVGGIGVRKMVADVAECKRTQHGIAHDVQDDVRIAVAHGP